MDRRAGLEQEGRVPALLGHPEQRHQQMGAGQGRIGVPETERLSRHGALHGPRAGHQWAHLRCPGPARRLPARRSTSGAVGERNVDRPGRQVRGQAPEQPQRSGLPFVGRALLYRPALRAAQAVGRPGEGTALPGRLSPRDGRHAHAAHQGAQRAQRARVFTGREDALRRAVRSGKGDLDEVPGQRRRHAWRGHGPAGCHRGLQGQEAGAARRLEGGYEGESLGDRARRRVRDRARRHTPRHDLDRRPDCQRRVGRRRLDALHHGEHRRVQSEDEDRRGSSRR